MVTPLESKHVDEDLGLAKKSGIKNEKNEDCETIIYCPLCIDPNLKSKLVALEKNPDIEVVDLICADCTETIEEDANNKETYTKRNSWRNIMTIQGHRQDYNRRMGFLISQTPSLESNNNDPNNAKSS